MPTRVDGNLGRRLAVLMGAGDDTFVWDPGDGSDVVEGGPDQDRLRFNGSAGEETFTAVGERRPGWPSPGTSGTS